MRATVASSKEQVTLAMRQQSYYASGDADNPATKPERPGETGHGGATDRRRRPRPPRAAGDGPETDRVGSGVKTADRAEGNEGASTRRRLNNRAVEEGER